VDVPIVHFSVEWWRTLHQGASVFNPELNPTIEGSMSLALLAGVAAFTFCYLYLLERRYRLAVLEEGLDDRLLADAIAQRQDEARSEVPA
jgi:heme exporter protein C